MNNTSLQWLKQENSATNHIIKFIFSPLKVKFLDIQMIQNFNYWEANFFPGLNFKHLCDKSLLKSFHSTLFTCVAWAELARADFIWNF